MVYFYDLEKVGTFGILTGNLRDTGTEDFRIHTTRTGQENQEDWNT
jgi:hypothetical protein